MKYIVIEDRGTDVFTSEHETKKAAIKDADRQFSYLTEYDKRQRTAFYVLESINPDEDAEDHFDGDIIKQYI